MVSPDWRRHAVVAYLDEPPFFSPTPNGDPIGCDIELTHTVLGRLGIERIEFVLTTFGELIPGLLAGRWHVNTPIFITADRSQLIDFSLPVWAAADGFIVRTSDTRDFSSYEGIAADDTIRLGVVTGQVQHTAASRAGVSFGAFSFNKQTADLSAAFDDTLRGYLGTPPHLDMMGRYGFSTEELQPVLATIRRCP